MLTLLELLEIPELRRARPRVVTPNADLEKAVRWVHTSEIFEIGPLLKGGEVLMTTGLGLIGRKQSEISNYVTNLVQRNVTALMIEIGRTFPQIPSVLINAAIKQNLTLIELHQVVPFVEITEASHRILLSRELSSHSKDRNATSQFLSLLATGTSIKSIIDLASSLTKVEVSYSDTSGISNIESGKIVNAEPKEDFPVIIGGIEHGKLTLFGGIKDSHKEIALAACQAIAILLTRGELPNSLGRREWLTDLMAHPQDPLHSSTARANLVGFKPANTALQSVIISGFSTADRERIYTSLIRSGIGFLVDLEDCFVLLLKSKAIQINEDAVRTDLEKNLKKQLTQIDASKIIFTLSDVSHDLTELGFATRKAVKTSRLLVLLNSNSKLRFASEMSGYLLLAESIEDGALEEFVREQLGALLEVDAMGAKNLVPTLEALALAGFSRTDAAAALDIRRQTLHNRIIRIEQILGKEALANPERRFSLSLALVAWRLRISAATRQVKHTPKLDRVLN